MRTKSKLLRYLLLVLLLTWPIAYTHAIPPPTLITGVLQAGLAVIGVITATVVILFYSLPQYVQYIQNRHQKTLGLVLGILLGSILVYGYQLWSTHNQNQSQLQAELNTLWERYNTVYIAPEEITANINIRSTGDTLKWSDFLALVGDEYLILDIRDTIPYQKSHVQNSTHIRFTDLLHGDWEKLLPYKNKPIYLLCYQGTTSALASLFLEQRGFTTVFYPEKGILGEKNSLPLHQPLFFPRDETKDLYIKKLLYTHTQEKPVDAFVIDLRLNRTTIPNINIDTAIHRDMLTTSEIEKFVQNLPQDQPLTLVCDSELSCYSADLLALDTAATPHTVSHIIDTRL